MIKYLEKVQSLPGKIELKNNFSYLCHIINQRRLIRSLLLSTNNIIEGWYCLYVVTFVVFLVLSERLKQATSKHVCKLFWNIKTVFRSNITEQNVKSRQSLITSKLSRRKAWFLNMFLDIVFPSLSTFYWNHCHSAKN